MGGSVCERWSFEILSPPKPLCCLGGLRLPDPPTWIASTVSSVGHDAWTMNIVHACTMMVVRACTNMIIVHACTMIIVHACTMIMVHVSCLIRPMVDKNKGEGSVRRKPLRK